MSRLTSFVRVGIARLFAPAPRPAAAEPRIFARIEIGDGQGLYAWHAVRLDPDRRWIPDADGPSGTLEHDPALEFNGNGYVQPGHVVIMEREWRSGTLLFEGSVVGMSFTADDGREE